MHRYTILFISITLFSLFLFLSSKNAIAQSLTFVWPSPSVVPSQSSSTQMAVQKKTLAYPSVIITPTIKAIPSPTTIPLPSPTQIPTAIPSPTPTLVPVTPSPSAAYAVSVIQSDLLNAINAYRQSKGLSAVKANAATCAFAAVRAEEITNSFNHDGFTNRINAHTLPYPSYSEVTENIAETSDYQQVVPMWINSPGHAENMQKDTPYVCVAQSGNYFAYEGWKP